jgi:cobalt-zinc-cadmium efflux system membrane fusion protein
VKSQLILLFLIVAGSLTACGRSSTTTESADAEHQEGAEDVAHISAEAARAANMEVATAGPATIRETIPLYGVVLPNGERVRSVSARYAGVVRSVNKAAGELAKAGETLATVESDDSLQVYAVTAPIAGVITARNVNQGEKVESQALFTVTDLSTVWVELSLFASDAARIRKGQRVLVRAVNGPTEGEGEIVWIAAVGSAATQSMTARVVLDNRERRWTPGLYVSADVVVGESAVPLGIKPAAIQTIDAQSVVFVVQGDTYTSRAVSLGRNDGDIAEVTAGVEPGERYVAANSFIVKAELGKSGAAHED